MNQKDLIDLRILPIPRSEESQERLALLIEESLSLLGEDPKREGLEKTPLRVAKAWGELTRGYDEDPVEILRSARFDAEGCDEPVLVRDIEFFSLCEHHMLPFFGQAHIAYLPNQKIVGLSKLARIVNSFARRLQVQERMTQQLCGALQEALGPRGVGVQVEAQHMCMAMRGVQKSGSLTVTRAFSGIFESGERRRELIELWRR